MDSWSLCFRRGLSGFSQGGAELLDLRVKFLNLRKMKNSSHIYSYAVLSLPTPDAFPAQLDAFVLEKTTVKFLVWPLTNWVT